MRKEGQSLRQIAKCVNKSLTIIQYIVNRHKELKSAKNRPRSGRPTKIQIRHKRAILKTINENLKQVLLK